MVRGFAANGFDPRDLTPARPWMMSAAACTGREQLNLRSAIPGILQEYGLKATAFVDAGSVFRYSGPTTFPGSAQSLQLANSNVVRSSAGAGLTWASPFGALTACHNDYDSVVTHLKILRLAFSLPIEDPNHMPVTRDLSDRKRAMILFWIDHPGADGLPVKGAPVPMAAAASEQPAAPDPVALKLEPTETRRSG
jgi:hypothetical protein